MSDQKQLIDEYRKDVFDALYSQLNNEKIDQLMPAELIGEYTAIVMTLGQYFKMIIEVCKESEGDIKVIYKDLLKQVEINSIKTYTGLDIQEFETYTKEI